MSAAVVSVSKMFGDPLKEFARIRTRTFSFMGQSHIAPSTTRNSQQPFVPTIIYSAPACKFGLHWTKSAENCFESVEWPAAHIACV